MTGVKNIKGFLKKQRFRRFWHVERMGDERAPKQAEILHLIIQKKGRPRKRWEEITEKDMLARE